MKKNPDLPRRAWPAASIAVAAVISIIGAVAAQPAAAQSKPDKSQKIPQNRAEIDRGRYLVKVTGCNDCHTPGYGAANGNVAEKLWLTGDTLGWNGPWGTTYATNLRIYMRGHTEGSWLQTARTFKARPPMPWFNVHAMSDEDLRAIYRYVVTLEPVGEPAPAFVPPDQKAAGPMITFPR